MNKTITNPLMIFSGGKWRNAEWIISHFPQHEIYVEPFGGGASVLLRKHRSKQEVYNDLNKRISNVFRVMRDNSEELVKKLKRTPYSRNELIWANEISEDPIEDARRVIVKTHMSRGRAMDKHKGFRYSKKSNRRPEQTWQEWVLRSNQFCDRLMGVLIENRNAIDLIKDFDDKETLFYLDPPYLGYSRRCKNRKLYDSEMVNEKDHLILLDLILKLKGKVMISGYYTDLYKKKLSKWNQEKRESWTSAHTKSVEVIWMNYFDNSQSRLI